MSSDIYPVYCANQHMSPVSFIFSKYASLISAGMFRPEEYKKKTFAIFIFITTNAQ